MPLGSSYIYIEPNYYDGEPYNSEEFLLDLKNYMEISAKKNNREGLSLLNRIHQFLMSADRIFEHEKAHSAKLTALIKENDYWAILRLGVEENEVSRAYYNHVSLHIERLRYFLMEQKELLKAPFNPSEKDLSPINENENGEFYELNQLPGP